MNTQKAKIPKFSMDEEPDREAVQQDSTHMMNGTEAWAKRPCQRLVTSLYRCCPAG